MNEAIFYTVINPETSREGRIYLEPLKADTGILLDIQGQADGLLRISKQQMAELGALLIGLAGTEVDADPVIEVLDGFELDIQVQIRAMLQEIRTRENLAENVEELASEDNQKESV